MYVLQQGLGKLPAIRNSSEDFWFDFNGTASRSIVCCFFVCKACSVNVFPLFGYRSPLKFLHLTCISIQSLRGNNYHNYNYCVFSSCHMIRFEFVWFPHIPTKLLVVLQFPRPSFSKYRRGWLRETICILCNWLRSMYYLRSHVL